MKAEEVYKNICGFSPNLEQIDVFNELTNWDTSKNPLLLRLPCGYGKTESVVIPFLTQAITGKWSLAPRMIYVLPTRALCNQIRDRICRYSERVHEMIGKIITVGIEHGTSSLDPLFFSDICITTFDQFLYGYARSKSQVGRHVDIPAGAFANSVIVFDEAHLYSPYTHALMKALLDILYHSKIPIIVMTATMPETLQKDIMYGFNPNPITFKGNLLNKRNISWEIKDWSLLKDEEPSKELINILNQMKNQKILIVANRVNIAQKLASELKDRGVKLIHSRFSASDRTSKENDIIGLLGKNSAANAGLIISTQVCEVGLDISCDLLITECASADALVQRIGRVARWGGEGKIIIVNPEKPVPYVDSKLEEKGDFVKISFEHLKNNPKLDFTSWEDTEVFCNRMEYHVDYVEARNAMGQVFEATLYADSVPYNLSARDEMYCTIFIGILHAMDKKKKAKRNKPEETGKMISLNAKQYKLTDKIPYGEIKPLCLNVSYLWFRRFWSNKDGIKKGLKTIEYDPEEQSLKENTSDKPPRPFRIYALLDEEGTNDEDRNYNSEIGLNPKSQETDEESCLIC
ncbi:MAG: CRISPR-associated helicase Cas3' [Bacteroidetes bacterium]|nr:MAG: CRISPR-associated helicase Cas3' [Bacteroidota bacterium]